MNPKEKKKEITAAVILGILTTPLFPMGLSRYYKGHSAHACATQNDVRILHALGYRLLRTYNLQFEHTPNLIRAIAEIKAEDPTFEMYLMLGTWIDCKDAGRLDPITSKRTSKTIVTRLRRQSHSANDTLIS